MITSDFISAIQECQIGSSTNKVLININAFGSSYRIDDIAIRVEDNLTQLQQAVTITLGVSGSTQRVYIPVNSSSTPVRVVDNLLLQTVDNLGVDQGAYFLYSILTANQRVVVSKPNTIYTTDVVIESPIGITNQILQDYSVLTGNTATSRESDFIVESDRSYRTSTSNTNPVNIFSIINNVAIPAKVQDSNYTATGWSNARYNGSKVNTTTNFGTDPFLQGTFFEGAFFAKDTADSYILDPTTILGYSQYFYSGKLDSLEYTLENLKLHVFGAPNKSLLLTASITPGTTPTTPPLFVGDLFRIQQQPNLSGPNAPSIFSQEIYEMIAPTGSQDYYPYLGPVNVIGGNQALWSLQIKNNYNNTPSFPLNFSGQGTQTGATIAYNSYTLYRIVPSRVYSIKGTVVQPTEQGKVRIKGVETIVYTNNNGYVLSGSNAPGSTYPNLI